MYRKQIDKYLPNNFNILTGPISMSVVFVMKRPKSDFGTGRNSNKLKKSARMYPTTRPDLSDNLMKALCDVMNDFIIEDDKQIINVNSGEIYGEEYCIYVYLKELKPGDQGVKMFWENFIDLAERNLKLRGE